MTNRSETDEIVSQEVILISSESENESSNCNNSRSINSNLLQPETKLSTNGEVDKPIDIEDLFDKFISMCVPIIKANKESSKIITFIKSRHNRSTSDFKSSPRYRNLLKRSIRKLSNGCKQEFVYINEVATVLGQHADSTKRRMPLTAIDSTSPKLRKVEDKSSCKDGVDRTENDETEMSGSSWVSETPQSKEIHHKIDKYEKLLKQFADEIKRLQAHELSLEEMDDEDSTYVQEAKLKRKAMEIFNKLCAIKKVEPKTGRVTERKVTVTSSRFPEINKKVELYVNRVRKFPDFQDIKYLVKRANEKSSLNLQNQEIEKISENLFKEIGKKLKHVRHSDYMLNFGSYLTDVATDKKLPDPAEDSSELLAKLKANRVKSETAMDEVFKKYEEKQEDSKDEQSTSLKEPSESEEGNLDSDPPSEVPSESDSESSQSEDDVEDTKTSDAELLVSVVNSTE